MKKRTTWMLLLLLALTGALVACGGGGAPPSQPAAESQAPAESQTADQPAAETEEEAPTTDEPSTDSSEPSGDAEASTGGEPLIAGRPAGGTDPDTGLEINPPEVVPGVDFIVRGEIVNANLTPQDSPEFVILSPSGTRFRIRAQDVSDIVYEDGTQPALHEFQRGVLVQATVRQEEGAGETITVNSTDLMLLHETE